MRGYNWLLLVLVLILVIAVATPEGTGIETQVNSDYATPESSEQNGLDKRDHSISYTSHDPIMIADDDELMTQASNENWPGSGTDVDPYVIEGFEIITWGNCIDIQYVDLYLEIRDCYFSTPDIAVAGAGVYLEDVNHTSIESCIFERKYVAIEASSSPTFSMFNCTLDECSAFGWITDCENASFIENTADYLENVGLSIQDSQGVHIENNTIPASEYGIELGLSQNSTIKNNTISAEGYGVEVSSCQYSEIMNNTISDGSDFDLQVSYSGNCKIQGNQLFGYGFDLVGASIDHFTQDIVENLVQGRKLGYLFGASSIDLDIHTYGQFYLVNCFDVTLRNGEISEVVKGLDSIWCNQIEYNNCEVNQTLEFGMRFIEGMNNRAINCTLYNSTGDGILVDYSPYAVIENCSIYDTESVGLFILSSSECTLEWNHFENCGMFIDGSVLSHWNHTTFNNTMNEKKLGFFNDQTGFYIDGTLYEQVFVVNCSNYNVTGGEFHDVPIGISVCYSDQGALYYSIVSDCSMAGIEIIESDWHSVWNVTVRDVSATGIYITNCPNADVVHCSLMDNEEGIYLDDSPFSRVYNTTVYKTNGDGIRVSQSQNTTILNNTIGWASNCIYAYNSDNFTIANNTLFYSYSGINLYDCDTSNITMNGVFAHESYGMQMINCEDNTVYGNEFAGNSPENAYDDGGTNNAWDNGAIGNGWDDYGGGGTYSISGDTGSVDNYPWMYVDNVAPWIVFPPEDFECEYQSIGVSITWLAVDWTPLDYIIWIDDVFASLHPWDGSEITVDVDTERIGVFNYTVVIHDGNGPQTVDTVMVNVTGAPGSLVITSNQDFIDQSWPGSGTPSSPYYYENFEASLDATCVYIADTDAYFELSGFNLSSSSGYVGTGIQLLNASNGVVDSCTITGKLIAINVRDSENSTLWNCTLVDNYRAGIFGLDTLNLTIDYCNISMSEACIDLTYSYYVTVHNSTLSWGSEYGLSLLKCAAVNVTHNTITCVNPAFSSSFQAGITVYEAALVRVTNNTLYSNEHSITIGYAPNSVIANNTVHAQLIGIVTLESPDCEIFTNTLIGCGFLIFGYTPETCHQNFTDNTVNGKPLGWFWNASGFVDGSSYGQIILGNCSDLTVQGGTFDNASIGAQLSHCTNCSILNISSSENYIGAFEMICANTTILDSTFSMCDMGFMLQMVDGGNYSNNEILNSTVYGMYLSMVSNCEFTYNRVYNSTNYGIQGGSNDNNHFYYNRFGWNEMGNAYDSNTGNTWDDGISRGNYWHDYVGVGTYPLNPWGSVVDRYPMLLENPHAPDVDSPDDVYYHEDATGNNIIWHSRDPNPNSFIVYVDDDVDDSGLWDGGWISHNIDGYDFGTHNVTLMVDTDRGYFTVDTVLVIVSDGTDPGVTPEDDIDYELGKTHDNITWSASDLHPSSYEIFRNGTSIQTGSWDGSDITVRVTGLGLGKHNFTLAVYDVGGNSDVDTVWVTVTPDVTSPILDHPYDIEYTEGETGNSITWVPGDLNPASYMILRDDVIIETGTWNSSSEVITVSVDGRTVGIYNFTLIVTDTGGNSVSDSVNVTVIAATTTTTTTTTTDTTTDTSTTDTITDGIPPTILVIVIGGAAGAIVIIVVIIYLKKRG